MKRLAFVFLISTVLLLGADVTGRWSGALTIPADEGTRTDPAYAVLKQDGAIITGTAGGKGEQHEIRNGRIEGDTVTFEVVAGERLFKLKLRLDGDTLAGDVSREQSEQRMTAKISLKRVP
jgi:hypothetical protein